MEGKALYSYNMHMCKINIKSGRQEKYEFLGAIQDDLVVQMWRWEHTAPANEHVQTTKLNWLTKFSQSQCTANIFQVAFVYQAYVWCQRVNDEQN